MNMENLLEGAKHCFAMGYASADRDMIAAEYGYSEKELDVVTALLEAMEYGFRSGFMSVEYAE